MNALRKFTKTDPVFLFLILIAVITGCTKIHIGEPVIDVPTPPALQNKPNIVLILADDVGYEVPTTDGGQTYSTPNIDMIAQMGLRFTQCHSAPLSSSSRFMLTTGKYNFRNYTTWGSLALTEHTLANLLHDAGYTTCVAGKWQFDNGDEGIKTFGYDKYCVNVPFKEGYEEEADSFSYKNPKLYENGAYLPDAEVLGKYGPDIVNQYVLNFIDSTTAAKKPFFIYYSLPLCHPPFSPTPDDAEFAAWDPATNHSDTMYYSRMVKYMDKLLGTVISKIKAAGAEQNTIVFFVGDNGTPQTILSYYKGVQIQGGKAKTTEYGTHVPLIAYSPGSIGPNAVSNTIIDFTDFLPTISDLTKTSIPVSWNDTDGVSFRRQLFLPSSNSRDQIYTWYNPHPDADPGVARIYVQDTTYKLYDQAGFYNIQKDILETDKLKEDELTEEEQQKKYIFKKIIESKHP